MAVSHPEYDAEKIRGGKIVLRRRWQKLLFMGGLFGAVALLALFSILAR